MPDRHFAVPRLARLYDPLDPDRGDLDAYAAMADEFGARSVVDVGCGTGALACLLAARGVEVTGVDPAAASLEVARAKPGAEAVRWVLGDAASLPAVGADLVTMTGNVAQVFLTDDAWAAALRSVRAALRPGGRFVVETRDPAREAWREWTREQTYRRVDVPGVGVVSTWAEITGVAGPLVSFRTTYAFEGDGAVLTSESTLRFRDRGEVAASLDRAGFDVAEVRDAPDRPGLELVFVAVRRD